MNEVGARFLCEVRLGRKVAGGDIIKNKKPKKKLPYAFPLSICLHDRPAWMPTILCREKGNTLSSSVNLSLHTYLKYAEMHLKKGVMAQFEVLISQPQAEWRGIRGRGGEIVCGKTVAPTATQTGFQGEGGGQ